MKKTILLLFINLLFPLSLLAQPPDAPISPAEAVSMLGKGILLEPQAGNVNISVSTIYKPEYGDSIKAAGFKSVRIRYQGKNNPMIIAIKKGPPYDAHVDSLLDETEFIINDLLKKNLAVVLTFYGLTDDKPGDLQKMADWWSYVANRFKNKSHKLIFNLFVEPWGLVRLPNHHRIMDYYNAITKDIRKTNPDRLLIYFKIPPTDVRTDPFGPGTEYFMTKAYDPVPQDAGIYYMWDTHVLKPDARDNVRLVQQGWEYMDSTKQVVWIGAWNAKNTDNKLWAARPMSILITRRLIDRGISSAYLMMFDGQNSIYDADIDRNGNGKLNEWAYPGLVNFLTSGPDIWWNMLTNPGFENGIKNWRVLVSGYSVKEKNENHYLSVPETQNNTVKVTQDVTLALKNNGAGKYDVLGYFTSSGKSTVKFMLKGRTADGRAFQYAGIPHTVYAGNPKLIHDKINADWSGKIETAKLLVEISGDSTTVDKLGLTQFYYQHPRLDISLWPGERIHHGSYTKRGNSIMEINRKIRRLMDKDIRNNNNIIASFAKQINATTKQLESRLIQLIGPDYQYTSEAMQYRIDGYYQGDANSQYKNMVKRYIRGKDRTAKTLNNKLINLQNQVRDYFILNERGFRELFFNVFRGYPPTVERNIDIDKTVSVNGMTLKANESGATYRWCDCNNLYNPIGGTNGRTFTPDSSGSYAVQISKNGFVVTSGCYRAGHTGKKDNLKQ